MYIYKITNLINGKVYIWQTIQTVQQRFWQHCCSHSQLIGRAIQKYGTANFTVEEIDRAATRDELDEKERYWIRYYNSQVPNGYNLEGGGTVYKEVNDQIREKIRQANSGENAPWYGKHLTEEAKKKLSASHMGKCKYWEGKKRSPETIEKIRSSRTGKYIGDTHWQSQKCVCVETGTVYASIGEAARITGINRVGIVHNLKGRSKSAGGFTWAYY